MSDKKVLDFTAKREEHIEHKRRAVERIMFDNFLGTYSVIDESGSIYPIKILDISRNGCLFQVPFNKGTDKKFSQDAENLLLTRHYSYNNVKELKEAVELAAEVSADNIISSECIFIGPKEESSDGEIDLSKFSIVKWFIKDENLKIIRYVILGLFIATSVLTIANNDNNLGRIANEIIWGLWWPGFIILLLTGRLWCTICPLSTTASFVKKSFSLNIKPPQWIKKTSHIIIPLGFVIIIIIEQAFHMSKNPAISGIFLLSLITIATIFSILYERETWCRYICPLGGLGAIYSVGGILTVKANPDVCASKCKTHECYKGSADQLGCPVFHHPLYAKESHVCKLCLNCLKSCPNSSAKLILQFPLIKIWKQKEMPDTLTIFAFTIFFMAPILILSRNFTEISFSKLFIILGSVAFIISYFISWILSKFENQVNDKNGFLITRIALALMILAWGPLAAFQFGNIPILNSLVINSSINGTWGDNFPTLGISLIKVLQYGAVIFAAMLGWIIIVGIKNQLGAKSNRIIRISSGIFIIYLILIIYLIIQT